MRSLFALVGAITLTSSLFAQNKPKTDSSATPAPKAPPVLIMYECEGKQCFEHKHAVWIFQGNHGEAIWPYGAVAELTITSFDGHRIVIERVDKQESSSTQWADPRTGRFHATYSGTLTGSTFDGRVEFNGVPEVNDPQWTAPLGDEDVCDQPALCDVGSEAITQLGMNAFESKLDYAASLCFRAAESRGDIEAEAMIGVMTFKGLGGIKADKQAGFAILTKTANAGSEYGQLALAEAYGKGIDGVPKNPQLAAMWSAAAEKTAHEKAAAQAAAVRQARMGRMSPQEALLLILLGSAFGGHGGQAASGDSAWSNAAEQQSRAEELERQNMSDCSANDAMACGRAGMSTPDPQ